MEYETGKEKLSTSKPAPTAQMTLQKAIEMGEYDPKFLATYAEWHTLTRHMQFQYIRQALDNRRRHLTLQWAEIVNVLDFSQKPQLQEALDNIQDQLNQLNKDRERLFVEYSVG